MTAVELSDGREARAALAWGDCWQARGADLDVRRAAVATFVEAYRTLQVEQRAERGYLPATLDGCFVVLELAVRICEALSRHDDARGHPDD